MNRPLISGGNLTKADFLDKADRTWVMVVNAEGKLPASAVMPRRTLAQAKLTIAALHKAVSHGERFDTYDDWVRCLVLLNHTQVASRQLMEAASNGWWPCGT